MIIFFSNFSFNFGATLLDNFSLIAVFFAISVIVYKNPVHSIISLIGLFLTVSIYLLVVNLIFAGLAYILVYVGAVTILFLFILMLIDIRISELLSQTKNSIPLVVIVSIALGIMLASPIGLESLFSDPQVLYIVVYAWDSILSSYNHITAIGNVLYSNVSIWLLVTSIILLLAMVGAIVITLKPQVNATPISINTLPIMECNHFTEIGYCLAPAISFIASAGNELTTALMVADHNAISSLLQQAMDNMQTAQTCLADTMGPSRALNVANPTDQTHFVMTSIQNALGHSQRLADQAQHLHQNTPGANYPHSPTSNLISQSLEACRHSEQVSSRILDHIKSSGAMPNWDDE